jgi:hypothetical protein
VIISRHPNSGQNKNIRIANESFENEVKFKYFGTTLENENDIHYEINIRLNSGNFCVIQSKIFSSFLILNKLQIKVYKSVIWPFALYGANWIQLAQDRVHWCAFVNTVMNLLVL